MPSDLSVGQIIRLTNFTNYFVPQTVEGRKVGLLSAGYKAGKGKVFVAVLLGVEDKDGSNPVDPEALMQAMGWQRIPKEPVTDVEKLPEGTDLNESGTDVEKLP